MYLMRLGDLGHERPYVKVEGGVVPVGDVVDDFDAVFFAEDRLASLEGVVAERVREGRFEELGDRRVGAPIARPHQILCVGLNYRAHAAESGAEVPKEPIVFNKAPNSMVGPYDDVKLPRGATKLDWEVELGVVIGRRSSYLPDVAAAREAIAGYVTVNDVSERSFQLERSGQWVLGKSAETFNPCGPYLVSPDELSNPADLELWTRVNGTRMQHATTASMIFSPEEIVRYLSQFMVLEPGDLINTGTPEGVGLGLNPQVWLTVGDELEVGIGGLGEQRQKIVAA